MEIMKKAARAVLVGGVVIITNIISVIIWSNAIPGVPLKIFGYILLASDIMLPLVVFVAKRIYIQYYDEVGTGD